MHQFLLEYLVGDDEYGYAITSSQSIKKRTKTKSITIPSQREISDVLTIKYRSK